MPVLAGAAFLGRAEWLGLPPLAAGMLCCLGLIASSEGLHWLLGRWKGNQAYFRKWDTVAMLPLLLPFFIMPLEPFVQKKMAGFALSVAGFVRFPWMKEGLQLSSTDYMLLLALGAGWIVAGFLRLLVWLRSLYPLFLQASIKNPGPLLFLTALAAGIWLQGWASAIYPPTGDEVHYLLMAKSFITDGDFDLKNNFANQDWQHDYPSEELDFHGHPDAQGRWICRHMPGISTVAAPLYWCLGSWGASLTTLILIALALAWLYGLARDLGAAASGAFLAYAIALISAPWSIWGYLVYPVAAGMLLVTAGLRLFIRLESSRTAAFLLGLLSCALPFFHQGLGIIGLVFLAAAGLRLCCAGQWRALTALTVGGLLAGLPFLWVFFQYYQTAHAAGDYAFSFRPLFFIYAVIGQLVDRNYGIITAAPVLLPAVAGLFFVLRPRHTMLVWLIFVFPVASGLQAALFVDWNGFSASFSRFLAPACAPLFVGLAFVLPVAGWRKQIMWVLAGCGALVSLSTWVMPALLYELPKERILTWLIARHVPPIWEIFPLLKGEFNTGVVVWGLALIALAAGVVALFGRKQKAL
ncbi:hypothetical protein JW933_11150 [candidate division FCPU426 bacterium]|nr:hypothetical protein [candidate division FCPU426 bacterium]